MRTEVNGVPAMTDGKNVYIPDPDNPGEYLGEQPKADTIVMVGCLLDEEVNIGCSRSQPSPDTKP